MLRRRLLLAGAPALGFLVLLVLVATHTPVILRTDAAVSAAALRVALDHPAWRAAMATITATGGPAVNTTVAVLGVALLLVAGRRRSAALVAAIVLCSTVARLLVLHTLARPRPAVRLAPASGWSFPSGHSTAAAATAAAVVVVGVPLLAHLWQRVAVTAVVLGWAVAVGLSRVALVVHWPADVLAAWLMVTSIAVAVAQLSGRTGAPRSET